MHRPSFVRAVLLLALAVVAASLCASAPVVPLTRTPPVSAAAVAEAARSTNASANANAWKNASAISQKPSCDDSAVANESMFGFVSGKWVIVVTIVTTLPWALVAVWDAIDVAYRSPTQVTLRLLLSSFCLVLAYSVGIAFIASMLIYTLSGQMCGREDELATISVLLIFNLQYVARNLRGWSQFFALAKLRRGFVTVQKNFARSFMQGRQQQARLASSSLLAYDSLAGDADDLMNEDELLAGSSPRLAAHAPRRQLRAAPPWPAVPPAVERVAASRGPCVQALQRLRISERLIDNNWECNTPLLNPFFRMRARTRAQRERAEEDWAVALWRAWWTQDTSLPDNLPANLTAPESFCCDRANRYPVVEDLMSTEPSGLRRWRTESGELRQRHLVTHPVSGEVITSREDWAKALVTYGGDEGQQDTHGEALPCVMDATDASGLAILVWEKTHHLANRTSALWYDTARFEDIYEQRAFDATTRKMFPHVLFPTWPSWLRIASDLATHLSGPVGIPDRMLKLLAGELAASSLILVRYADKYAELVRLVHEDGVNARWTFGWSGLLACFSHLWTWERLYVALLNGLSLLALASTENVQDIDENVRAMLYGYAAFAVSDRAVGKRIAEDRKHELLRRYKENKGKTCRGAGLCATRLACQALGLPAEASHMDGLPAFSTGWASEFMARKPGNQTPEHGRNHDEIEELQGSSNMWRYPHSHT